MPVNNEYKRYFIILQEDDKGFDVSAGKIPTGYVKIEVKNGKCKMNTFVQNVKCDEKMEYRLTLVAPAKKVGVDVGKIMIDGGGRGELYYEFESDNVLKSGLSISEFLVAAVTSSNSIPLSGYIGRDRMEWKGKYDVVNRPVERVDKKTVVEEVVTPIVEKIAPVIEKLAPIVEIVPIAPIEMIPVPEEIVPEIKPEIEMVMPTPPIVIPIEVPVEKPVKAVVENIMENVVENVMENVMEKPVQVEVKPNIKPEVQVECEVETPIKGECRCCKDNDMNDVEYFYYDDESSDDSEDCVDTFAENMKCKKQEVKAETKKEKYCSLPYYKSYMYKRLKKSLRKLRRTEPFSDDDKHTKWFKVEDDIYMLRDVGILCMGNMMPLAYPFMMEEHNAIYGRMDYILGVKYDRDCKEDDDDHYIKYVYFGIPGRYTKNAEAYYRMRGYSRFKPHRSRGYGYWLMCVDIRTGQIMM